MLGLAPLGPLGIKLMCFLLEGGHFSDSRFQKRLELGFKGAQDSNCIQVFKKGHELFIVFLISALFLEIFSCQADCRVQGTCAILN